MPPKAETKKHPLTVHPAAPTLLAAAIVAGAIFLCRPEPVKPAGEAQPEIVERVYSPA